MRRYQSQLFNNPILNTTIKGALIGGACSLVLGVLFRLTDYSHIDLEEYLSAFTKITLGSMLLGALLQVRQEHPDLLRP